MTTWNKILEHGEKHFGKKEGKCWFSMTEESVHEKEKGDAIFSQDEGLWHDIMSFWRRPGKL